MRHNNTTCRSSLHVAFPPMKKFCVLTFHTRKTEAVFQWEFHKKYGENLSAIHSIHAMVRRNWLHVSHSPHTPSVNEANTEDMQQAFTCSSNRSCHADGQELISHTLLCGEPLQLQLLQHITEDDKHCFCCKMLDRITDDKIYLMRTSLSEETFHMSSSINDQL